MKLRRVVVVYKKSSYQVYAKERQDQQIIRLLRSKHQTTERIRPSHASHSRALSVVQKVLEKREIQAKFVYRAQTFSDDKIDCVMTVGGDGTFLEASGYVTRAPMLGINSSPDFSVGAFCGTTYDQFEEALDRIEQDQASCVEVARLSVRIGEGFTAQPVLNDVLISNSSPGATSRYLICLRDGIEDHKSSGVWVATAAGSTAVIRGAGGKILPVKSKRFQFVVREPYVPYGQKVKLLRGILGVDEELLIQSKMRKGKLFLDGSHRISPFPVGEKVVISNRAAPLRILGFDRERRQQMEKWAKSRRK